MNKKPKKRVIYETPNLYEEARKLKEKYSSPEYEGEEKEFTDSEIFDRATANDAEEWRIEGSRLHYFFLNEGSCWLLKGTIQRWNGTFEGGFIFRTLEEMYEKINKDLEDICIWDTNGHFYIEVDHHDGINHFEIKKITPKGEVFIKKNDWRLSERELHTKLLESSTYSTLPHYMHKVYGCKMREYEKEGCPCA